MNFDYDETYQIIPWVITSADGFDDSAEEMAKENGVRLIAEIDFAKMLLDAGIANLLI